MILLKRIAQLYSIGVLFGCLLIATILIQSDGLEPSGVCEIVSGTEGLLPLNPNEGGIHIYSCNPDFLSAFLYACLAGIIFTPLLILLSVGKKLISRK
ncbi:MAG: hypothetical protein ACNI26_13595 [Terasakiella sp.]|uniref:hypothetical protein n=1 Tax=unclassified Terasakiella TaxID=2614952 RepID=UPI003B0032B9